MKKIYYKCYVKTIDGAEYNLNTEQTHEDCINYDGNYGMVCIEDKDGTVYTFALKNIIVFKHI